MKQDTEVLKSGVYVFDREERGCDLKSCNGFYP